MVEEERPVSEELLGLLENPVQELHSDTIRRIIRAVVETEVPDGLEELGSEILSIWSSIVERIVDERLMQFIRGAGCRAGLDADVCRLISRLREAYRALLQGMVLLDDAGRAYVRLKQAKRIAGLDVPQGAITAVDVGEALILYAIGEAELASIKPLKE